MTIVRDAIDFAKNSSDLGLNEPQLFAMNQWSPLERLLLAGSDSWRTRSDLASCANPRHGAAALRQPTRPTRDVIAPWPATERPVSTFTLSWKPTLKVQSNDEMADRRRA